jgi:predicted permease
VNWIIDTGRDLRQATRFFLRAPGLSVTVIATLALGIGANLSVFSIADAVLFKMLPVQHPESLQQVVHPAEQDLTEGRTVFSFPEYREMRDAAAPLARLAAAGRPIPESASIGGQPAEEIRDSQLSGNSFALLGVPAALGRVFRSNIDHEPEKHPEAVISYSFWRNRFNRDPNVLGRVIRIRNTPYQVIGVTPAGFYGLDIGTITDVWTPITTGGSYRSTSPIATWRLLLRTKPGVTPETALAPIEAVRQRRLESAAIAQDLKQKLLRHPLALIPAGKGFSSVRGEYGRPLWVVMALAAMVLLMACVNIANLLLARAGARQHEIAVRASVGASRGRILRQLMTESVLLAGIASPIGLLCARWTARLLVSMLAPSETPVQLALDLDWRLLGFTAALATGTVLAFGLVPAWRGSKVDLLGAMKGDARQILGGARIRSLLVGLQVALSVVLLAGAALFLRTLRNVTAVDPGFDARNLLVANVSFRGPRDGRTALAWEELLRRVSAIPGVEGAALSTGGPFLYVPGSGPIHVPGQPPKGDVYNCGRIWISPGFFRTMGTPLAMGRDFGPRDSAPNAPRVAIVNEALAREYFPGQNPLGRFFSSSEAGPPIEIVAVARDTKFDSLRESAPLIIYQPYRQSPTPLLLGRMALEIRARRDAAGLAPVIRREALAANPAFVVTSLTTETKLIDDTLFRERLLATVAAFFGAVALLLAAVGLYGMISCTVTQRTREIGIRVALGATRHGVVGIVLREALASVAVGSIAGLAAAAAFSRLFASLLFGLKPGDPIALGLAVAALLAIALAAAILPARRAASMDPMTALRYE